MTTSYLSVFTQMRLPQLGKIWNRLSSFKMAPLGSAFL